MEIEANELFDAYRELYFEGGTSSVYFWDLPEGFAGCFLIKKGRGPSSKNLPELILLCLNLQKSRAISL
jgi:capping protein beta